MRYRKVSAVVHPGIFAWVEQESARLGITMSEVVAGLLAEKALQDLLHGNSATDSGPLVSWIDL